MRIFKDKDGREWQIGLNLAVAMKIEGFDFAEALREESPYRVKFLDSDESEFETYLTNTAVCFTMVWLCCENQADSRGITDMLQFAEIFDGKTWDDARMMFMEELTDFFPRRATTLRALIDKYSRVVEAQDKMMAEAIEKNITDDNLKKMNEKAQAEIRTEMDKIVGQ